MVSYVQRLFGRRVSRQKSVLPQEIRQLLLIRRHWYKDSDGDRQEKPAELRIEGGGQKIILGGKGGGIEDEETIDWLAYEISEWLDLPLTVIE